MRGFMWEGPENALMFVPRSKRLVVAFDNVSIARAEGQRLPGGVSRWNAGKDLSFVPLRIGLVAEVAYEGMLNGRFRHSARFVRWRDDRVPESCTYAQLEEVPPLELRGIFGGSA